MDWMCEALGVSRGGFYGWLTRPRSQRDRRDEEFGAMVRASFLASDRAYGARRRGVLSAWSMNAAMTAQLVTDALVMAIWRRGKPDALLHHSDRGSPVHQ